MPVLEYFRGTINAEVFAISAMDRAKHLAAVRKHSSHFSPCFHVFSSFRLFIWRASLCFFFLKRERYVVVADLMANANECQDIFPGLYIYITFSAVTSTKRSGQTDSRLPSHQSFFIIIFLQIPNRVTRVTMFTVGCFYF